MTERTPLADDDVIDLLRRVAPGPSTLDVDGLLVRSRRSVARRRAASLGALTTGVAAAAVAVGLALGPGLGRTGTLPALPAGSSTVAVTPAPVTPTTSPSPAPPTTGPSATTPAGASRVSLLSVFGGDWGVDTSGSSFAGDIRVAQGSAAASGLPSGYEATVRLFDMAPGTLFLDDACRARTEKGLVSSACTPVTTSDGTAVQRQDGEAVVAGRWSYSSIRLILERPDGSVRLLDLMAVHEGSVAPQADRDRAAAWLEGELAHAETAVVSAEAPLSS